MLGLSDGLEAPSPRDTACVMALAECNGASPQRCIRSGEPDQALLLYAEGGRALEHAAQGGRGISLSLETLQTHLDVILSHLLQLTLPGRGGWTR